MMNLKLALVVIIMCISSVSHGEETVGFDTPEGWAMAFMTASTQNLGHVPVHFFEATNFSLSGELSTIPHLTKAQQKIGFGGFKDEDLTKSPVFGRLRATFGLSRGLNAEISWTPPLEIKGTRPDHLWGAAVNTPLLINDKIDVGLRLFILRGDVTASVTCSETVLEFAPYTNENFVGCVGLSNDKLQLDHEGVELSFSASKFGAITPWVSLAVSAFDNSVLIDAPLRAGTERVSISSRGIARTFTFGVTADVGAGWVVSASTSYTPLEARRPEPSNGNDNFWNFRLGLTRLF